MDRDQKATAIEEVATQIRDAQAVFAIDYRGLSVGQAADLRTRLLDADATLRVVKNRLTERSADQAGAESLKALLTGPTALTFVRGDVAVAAKALSTFRRESQLLEFKGGTLAGEELTIDQIESIARLPARDVLRGQFIGVLASPISGLARGLSSLVSGIAIQLRQIQEQGLVGGGEAPQAEQPAPEVEQAAPVAEEPAPDVEQEPDTTSEQETEED